MPLHDNNDNRNDVCHAEISRGDAAFHKEGLRELEEEERPLPHDHHDNNDMDNDNDDDDDDEDVVPRSGPTLLQRQVIRVIESSAPLIRDGAPDQAVYKVRPALLVTQLGLSMDDATEELCGLLSAVGSTATFGFETMSGQVEPTMVFYFPRNVARRAQWRRRVEWTWEVLWQGLQVAVRVLRIVVAFGILLSLTLVTVVAMVAMVAALVALSRAQGGGGRHHEQMLLRRMHAMAVTLREVLWMYALWGPQIHPDDNDDDDYGFFRTAAADLAMGLTLCCGSPGSLFFWIRTRQWQQRRQLAQRRRGRGGDEASAARWGRWNPLARSRNSMSAATNTTTTDSEGVALVRMGTWHQREEEDEEEEENVQSHRRRPNAHRGLLSVIVEFLFGPTPFWPGPTRVQKWKWRAQYLITASQTSGSVSLSRLLAWVDHPPSPTSSAAAAMAQGLQIVTHFHGKPAATNSPSPSEEKPPHELSFVFAELLGEGVSSSTPQDEDDDDMMEEEEDASSRFWYRASLPTATMTRQLERTYLHEQQHVLTKLTRGQFCQCWVMGILNYFGVLWLRQIVRGGLENEQEGEAEDDFVRANEVEALQLPEALARPLAGVVSLLRFYSLLFLALPCLRALLISVWWNRRIQCRNQWRRHYAAAQVTPPSSPKGRGGGGAAAQEEEEEARPAAEEENAM